VTELKNLKVAIVHDWLYGGGAELVVEQLHKMFPDAPIYASFCTDEWRQRLDNKVVTGFLQRGLLCKFYKYLGFLRIWWYTHLRLEGYDLVISSSGAEAKGIKVPDGTLHVNYCHAPTHYYWSRYDEYMQHPGFGALDPLARIGLRILVAPLRRWDLKAAQRPHYIIANSAHIQSEIKKYYGRDSVVIHPPVYFERFQKPENSNLPRHGFVISGRQTPYKRFDLAIRACSDLELPLTVIGEGPDRNRLQALAGPTITFLGRAPDDEVERQFASAEALIFPGLDDFGITPIEAMAAGTPVIALKGGGALDYVVEGKTGRFFEEPTTGSLSQTLQHFNAADYISADIKAVAEQFAPNKFQEKLNGFLTQLP
jgi:glycosyltransferase involved in cell wall biosynthesis